jgi:hypothetical protein
LTFDKNGDKCFPKVANDYPESKTKRKRRISAMVDPQTGLREAAAFEYMKRQGRALLLDSGK